MENFNDFFRHYPNGVLATVDAGVPKTRVFQYLWGDEGKIYFCTANTKLVYKQLKANDAVTFCSSKEDYSKVVSVTGKAVFVNDINAKQKVLDINPRIKAIYKDGSNPEFEMFYIDISDVETFTFIEGSKSYKLK